MQHFSRSDIQAMEQRYRAAFINSLGGFSGLDSYHTTHLLARLTYAKPNNFPKEI